jgi:hypothetical protein
MKYLLQFLFILSVCTVSFAQSEDDDELVNLDTIFPESVILSADTCLAPVVTDVTVLQFATYAAAQVTVFPADLVSTIYYKELGSELEYSSVQVSETGSWMVQGLGKGKTYQIAVQNLCGVLMLVGIIDTKTEFEGTVTVSEKLHFELNRYLKEESSVKLTDFLRDLTSVSLFERASFVQRFFFKGAPLLDGAPLEIPEIEISATCFCNSIITTQLAIPANLVFLIPGSGNVEDYTQQTSGGNVGNNLGHNARTWHWMNNKGPGKYHQLWTEGFKAKRGLNHQASISWLDNNGIASQKSYIRVTLICLDGDEVPAECGCEKDIEFAYRYDTRVTAHASLRGTTNARSSWAQAEDMYTVIFEDESLPLNTRYEVIDMNVTRAASACDWSVNPAFWTNITTLLGDGAKLYLAYQATQNGQNGQQPNQAQQNALTSAITAFASTLGSIFTTPYGQSTGCNNDDDKFGVIEKNSVKKTFKPNATVTFSMNSYNKIASGGKRKWHSHGRVLSGHYLTGVVSPNAFDHTPVHCCTPKIGMWLVGHCGGSATEDQLKVQAADLLYHNGITNLIQTPSGISVVNDFGYTVQPSSLQTCNQIVVNPTVSGGRSNDSDILTNETEYSAIQIYDVNGRLVKTLQWIGQFEQSDLASLYSAQSNLPMGIYFVLISNKTDRTTYKLFIH